MSDFKSYEDYRKSFATMKDHHHGDIAFKDFLGGATHGDLNLVKAYIDVFGTDRLDEKDKPYQRTALFYAIHFQHKSVAKYLLSKGADINTKDAAGDTPLMVWALRARAGHPNYRDFLLFLLDQGADPTIPARDTQTPADFLSFDDQLKERLRKKEGVRLSQAKTALRQAIFMMECRNGLMDKVKNHVHRCPEDIFGQDHTGKTCLYFALLDGKFYNVAEFLIKHKADVNVLDHDGHSLLMYAVIEKDLKAVDFLIKNHADIYQKGSHGITAYDILRQELAIVDGVDFDILYEMKKIFDAKRKADFSNHMADQFNRGSNKNLPSKKATFKKPPPHRHKP